MAITRACIGRFHSNLAQSFTTWQPIHSFNVKGSKVKVTAYVTDNADWLRNLCEFVAYLTLTSARGTTSSAWVVCRRNFSKRNIFEQKKPRKCWIYARSTGAKSRWPSSCNAFAIARFLVMCSLIHTVAGMLSSMYLMFAILRSQVTTPLLVPSECLTNVPCLLLF